MQPQVGMVAIVDWASIGQTLHCRAFARADPRRHARGYNVVPRLAFQLSSYEEGELAGLLAGFPQELLGSVPDPAGAGRNISRPVHADRGCRHGCGLCLHHRRIRLQGTQARRCSCRADQGGGNERDDFLHHHQRRGVLLAPDIRAVAIHGGVDDGARVRNDRVSARHQYRAARSRQFHRPRCDRAHHGTHSFSDGSRAGGPPGTPGDSHGGQYGGGALSPAGRIEPLRCLQHEQDGNHRTHHRRAPMARDHAGVSGHGDLHPRHFANRRPGQAALAEARERLVRLGEREERDGGLDRRLGGEAHEMVAVGAGEVGNRADAALAPQDVVREARDVRHVDAGGDHPAALPDRMERRGISAPTEAKMIAASSSTGAGSSEAPAHSAPSSLAKRCAAKSPARVKA